jgi:hypothetical protein
MKQFLDCNPFNFPACKIFLSWFKVEGLDLKCKYDGWDLTLFCNCKWTNGICIYDLREF